MRNTLILLTLPLIYPSHALSNNSYIISEIENRIITTPIFDKEINEQHIQLNKEKRFGQNINKINLTNEIIDRLEEYLKHSHHNIKKQINKKMIEKNEPLLIQGSVDNIELREEMASFFADLPYNNELPIQLNTTAIINALKEKKDILLSKVKHEEATFSNYEEAVKNAENALSNNKNLFVLEKDLNLKINSAIDINGNESNINKNNIEENKKNIKNNKININNNEEAIKTNKTLIIDSQKTITNNTQEINKNGESIKDTHDQIKDITYKYLTNLEVKNFGKRNIKEHIGELHTKSVNIKDNLDKLNNDFQHFKSNIQNHFHKIEKRANQGIASVAAMSNLPFTDTTTFSSAIGIGNYRNATSFAWGMQYRIHENVKLRASTAWNDSNHWVSAGGVGISW